ncbi:MAG: hypothetical protein DRR16_16260 [Candidatus Parabeggiatoa sp. nov. 3]|nr:MAG: hypothetical protein DRR00_12855 [Gammaproteobacteria bacterium]RKZ66574.1 MAG: hypothetical protein DRQ99_09220 [Gammaproteobacteria bacterium]RKZ83827.1 MAG: hypothetical protein DRR16_16260 [Gammaproteobacteria bacterium]
MPIIDNNDQLSINSFHAKADYLLTDVTHSTSVPSITQTTIAAGLVLDLSRPLQSVDSPFIL